MKLNNRWNLKIDPKPVCLRSTLAATKHYLLIRVNSIKLTQRQVLVQSRVFSVQMRSNDPFFKNKWLFSCSFYFMLFTSAFSILNMISVNQTNKAFWPLVKTLEQWFPSFFEQRLIIRLVHGNVIPMGIPWETSHGMGQHTFVFPMRLRNRMRVSECCWIVMLRLYFWILKSINFVFLHVSLYMQSYWVDTKPKLS